MYNMEISIGSYKCRLEILILIFVVFWVMFGHVLCGCCRVNLFEAFTAGPTPAKKVAGVTRYENTHQSSDSTSTTTEGFTNSNNSAMGPEFGSAKTPGYIMDPSTWSMPTLSYSPGTTPDAGVKAIWDRPKQPIPLPKDELDMFATTPIAPECCPNAYSSSTGCACMTTEQYQYLRERGSNNVPYSEY